ncbi:FecCD family ABC transporter permease [Myroides sp. LJL116]
MKKILQYNALWIVPLAIMFISILLGSTKNTTIVEFIHYTKELLFSSSSKAMSPAETILWNVRLPRVILTFLVGASLASAGGVLQAIFRNPIVDPFTLGISSGAAFGAALAMLFPIISLNISAFVFGVIAVVLTYSISYVGQKASIVGVVLSGIIISGIFTALLTLLQYISDPYKLQAIIQWTMGNLHTASWSKVQQSILPIALGLGCIVGLGARLNLLSLGDQEAKAVGINPFYLKIALVSAATLITAASVAAVGVISLFGLIVPHISRMIYGPDNRVGVWANISIGGCFLLVIDLFSRTVMPFELPVGVFTMIIGAPIFIYLMKKSFNNLQQ